MACVILNSWLTAACQAEDTLKWSTNHYYVTGSTIAGIRKSMNHARPGGTGSKTDGVTVWKVSWRYRVRPNDQGCRVESFTTDTIITMTMPAWNAPPNADEETKKSWSRYYTSLLRHEVGHAQIAQSAAEEIRKRVAGLRAAQNCPSLRKRADAMAQAILAQFRQRDTDYDRRTRHGMKEGAHFP